MQSQTQLKNNVTEDLPKVTTWLRPKPQTRPHLMYAQQAPREGKLFFCFDLPEQKDPHTHVCMYLNRHASKNKKSQKGEDKTGPTHPLQSETQTARGPKKED